MVILSGYTIKEELYKGEKSIVYRAVKAANVAETSKPVILKVLHNEYPSPAELNAFRQEYEILEKIQSPGIVRTIGLEKYKNSYIIVFEDIGGAALSLLLSEIRKFSIREFLELMKQATIALGEVHKLNLVHKDIKSQNIILNKETRKLQIIDFGNASLLAKQTSYTSLNSSIEGTIAFISPEQTGRMNRTVDYRTDYYSLGVTFYQLLTSELPFVSVDPMELVHAHIAKMPVSPFEKNKTSKVISDIIMKLLQKNPEDRYQSIKGLLYDLEWCLNNIDLLESAAVGTGRDLSLPNNEIQIGTHDHSGKFQIPEKLFGRTNEINQIIETFKSVAYGKTQLHLISGHSGIGKSALINEVNKPITEYKGYFASGKYDQFKRSIPYSAITQAIQSLIQQILTENSQSISLWKETLTKAVGTNGQIVVDVIPELETLIGTQPPAPELGATESQNRFNLVFQNFIQAFCTKEHPIAIFLDDLQWADTPSINLIQTVLSYSDMKYFYLMLSFRDNEVLPTDPFSLMLEALKKSGFSYKEILLTSIGVSDISHLVRDTLNCEEPKAKELAGILFEKTNGNPFFVNELFKSFYDRDLISYSDGTWKWDISKIKNVKISSNVVDLMIQKVKELPASQMETLKLSACIGDSFSIELLSQISGKAFAELKSELEQISNEGFLLIGGNTVKFIHDKIREATYSLIPEDDRAKNHYAIGSTYLKITKEEDVDDLIFTIANQLNQGISLTSEEEKVKLLDLNVVAGDKALLSSAYESSLEYFIISASLLPDDSWENKYELALNIFTKLGRLEYLTGSYTKAEEYFDLILNKAKTILEQISVYEIKMQLYTSRNQLSESLSIGLQALELLGVTFPEVHDPTPEIGKSFQLMGTRNASDLLEIPLNFEPNQFAILRLLASCSAASYISLPSLFPMIVLKIVNISIEFGNFPVSPVGYAFYGNILCSAVGNYSLGHAFGKLAMDLVDEHKLGFLQSTVYFIYATMINHWKNHAIDNLDFLIKGHQVGVIHGNLQLAAYNINHYNFQSLLIRKNLADVVLGFERHLPVFNKINQYDALQMFTLELQLAKNLSGLGSEILVSLNSELFDEEGVVSHWLETNNLTTLFCYYLNKLTLNYLFGSTIKAYEFARQADPHAGGCFGMMFVPEHTFFDSLSCLALIESSDSTEADKVKYKEQIQKNQERMKVWAENCPANYGHKYLIVNGLLIYSAGDFEEARQELKKAIALAKEHEYILEEALANEFLAKMWREKEEEQIANIFLVEAHYAYKKWGCSPKVKQLEEKFPQLKRQATQTFNSDITLNSISTSLTKSISNTNFLDLNTVVKASQAISGEIQLGKLLEKMMKILFENAGAERGFFILKENETWVIEAEGNANSETISVLEAKPLEEKSQLSSGIVNYVIRTKSIVLLNDAMKKGMFTNDSYVIKRQPKSILCYPIINQGNLVGVVYLENNLTTDAFTPDRVEILKILSSQIAVSVENSLLYANLEVKVIERTAQVNEMLEQVGKLHLDSENKRKEIESLAESRKKLSMVGQMAAGIVHDIKNPMASIKYLAETLNDKNKTEEKKAENVVLILREMDRLSDLTFEILDFSKGKINLDKVEINIKEFLEDIKKFLVLDFEYQGVRFSLDMQYTGSIHIDRDRMRRVIINIAKNALEAMYDGKKEYELVIRVVKKMDKVILSLIDNGPGLPDSVKANMFQVFATEGKAKGTGLGLFMCKSIVDTHNGELRYESEAGNGTSFHIHLPIK